MFKFFKKQQKEKSNEVGFEERERKTPILGYILLVAMVFVVWMLGSSALNSLRDIPKEPERLSFCASSYVKYNWSDVFRGKSSYVGPYNYNNNCVFSSIERKYGVDKVYIESEAIRDELKSLKNELSKNKAELNRLKYDYKIGLMEDIAGKKAVFDSDVLNKDLSNLKDDISNLELKIDKKEKQLIPYNDELRVLYVGIKDELDNQWAWYDFYVFLLQSLFIFPLFLFLLKTYFNLSSKNSPYLIIFTFLLIPVSIFVLSIVFVYFWGLFLAVILESIWNLVKDINILKSILSYLGMILAATLFGGSVYLLQKRIFDPKRMAKKYMRDNKCPSCSFSLNISDDFCSNCGHKLLNKCKNCGERKYIDLPVCKKCGSKDV